MEKLLVVDDSEVSRNLLKKILAENYDIIEASNGYEAMASMYKEYKVLSAVLLDVHMPVMDGFQVLKMRRNNPILAQIPIIIITGSNDAETKKKAIELGAASVLTKPYQTQSIIECLAQSTREKKLKSSTAIGNLDHLTQIYRREFFFESASKLISEHDLGYYTISCMNIDGFKVINDQYGTNIGDKLLQHVAGIIKKGVEKVEGICGRINSDDFVALIPSSSIGSYEIDEMYQEATSPKFLLQKIRIRIGRYSINDNTIPVSTMFDRAKIAANSIRSNYDTYIAEYSDTMRNDLIRNQKIIGEMEYALQNGQFEPWFQPQYNHSTGAMIGAEALVRWNKDGTYISPAEFIPLFEENGFIYKMDKNIWEQVCILLRKWLDNGISPLSVSINVSRKDIYHMDFIHTISELIEKYHIPANLLRLEVTESSFSESTKVIVSKVNELIALGFTVEIDDFGSGYSSLNTLKDVPASTLKLDMKFFENAENNQRSGNIVESIVRMAKRIGMTVIAEGVENKVQADYLKSIGCNYIQGYYYAKPMPVNEYEKHLNTSLQEYQQSSKKALEPLDNNDFWDPNSIDTLIYNGYVGAACIIEYANGKIEMIRANEFYKEMLGGKEMGIKDLLSFDWTAHMDDKTVNAFHDAVIESAETKKPVTDYFVFYNIPGCPEKVYLKSSLRVIANIGDRHLVYCLNENITAQREAEIKEHNSSVQLQTIMANIPGGITATLLKNNTEIEFIFANDGFYEMYGYTKEQMEAEVPNALDLILPEDKKATIDTVKRIIKNRGSETYIYRCYKRDGSIMWTKCTNSVIEIEGINETVLLGVEVDVTKDYSNA